MYSFSGFLCGSQYIRILWVLGEFSGGYSEKPACADDPPREMVLMRVKNMETAPVPGDNRKEGQGFLRQGGEGRGGRPGGAELFNPECKFGLYAETYPKI
jgi:hypothetical protein